MVRDPRLVPRVVVVVSTTGAAPVTVISSLTAARSTGFRLASLSRPTDTCWLSAAKPLRLKLTV